MKETSTESSGQMVWVIDDDETGLLMAEDAIANDGFRVRAFADPQRALEALADGCPDIIGLDVMMPGMDGYEFCRRLRGLAGGRDIPVLMMTSLDDLVSINRAYEAGATDFAVKPINWNIETHRLRYMLRAAGDEKKLRQKELETRLAKEDWEKTFDAISDLVTVLDADLRIQRANAATVRETGQPLDRIIGSHCYSVFQNATEPCPDCPVVRALKEGVPQAGEKQYARPAGDRFVTAAPVIDPQGRVTHIVQVARDLSEQKLLEAEILQAQKLEAIGTLAGGIAHDFNNLLQVVLGFSSMLAAEAAKAGRQDAKAQAIVEAAQRGRALTQQMLTFSRRDNSANTSEVLNLNLAVERIQTMLERVLPKTVTVRTRLALDLKMISANPGQLEQVLMNLAINAADAMSEEGMLTLETQNARLGAEYCHTHPHAKPGDYVLLTVSDTGHGMDPHTMERMYDPFFTTKGVGKGTGLGLAMVFGIVKAHGGEIRCYSQPGLGTTFGIYFPAIATPAGQPAQPVLEPVAAVGGSETLLLVDDEALIRKVVRMFLNEIGYTVIVASDGNMALKQYTEERERIKLVIMDLGMPGMSGFECLGKIHQLNPNAKILVTTGYAGDDVRARVQQLGAAGIVHKPFDVEQLAVKIRSVLDAPTAAAPK